MSRSNNNHKKELEVIDTQSGEISVVKPLDTLIPEQGRILREAMDESIDPHAIDKRPGPNNTVLKYVKHGYVTDMLNKVFGPFWSFRAVDVAPGQKYALVEYSVESTNRNGIKETKQRREIIVMGELRIRIYSSSGQLISEEVRSGSGGKVWENNINFADALQSAESESLKRAAFRLGRKFGLALYYDDEARQAEYAEANAPRVPTTVGQLMGWLQQMDISDEEFARVVGWNIGDPGEDGKPRPRERDVAEIYNKIMESRNAQG